MEYKKLADVCQELEEISSYLEKNEIISDLLKKTSPAKLEMVVILLLGRVFPAYKSQETGLGLQQLKKVVGKSTGYSETKINELMEELGDLGKVAEELTKKKKQTTLAQEKITVKKVNQNLRKIPQITGEGSVNRKIRTVSELLTSASPEEAKFITRTILGDLRIGVAEGRLRDAIAEAFDIPPEKIEHAYMLTTNYGKVAKAAAQEGEKGLSELGLTVGHPVNPMLAQRAEDIDEILERMNGKASFEMKLDGIRIQPHKKENEISLFTRRMEDYTDKFPELEKQIKNTIKPEKAIVDGELVAINKKTSKPMPFQEVLHRRRKYDIEKVAEEIPVQVHLFDVLLSGNKTMIEKPYQKRREELEKIINPSERIKIVEKRTLENKKEIKSFQTETISKGHEGLIAKNPNSNYRAGKREFAWLKLKAKVETLDLAVVGAFAGKGDRAGTFGSYLLAAQDSKTETLKTVTRVGSGFTDEDLERLTKKFEKQKVENKPTQIDSEIDPDYWFKPQEVFEINYEEIQKSPSETHTSGYGLRFPRFVRVREDLNINSTDTVKDIEKLFKEQEGRKSN